MFSVIIPLYNKTATVERAINSVLAQTESAFELIIVDDGSTDDGPEKVKALRDPKIRLIQQANGGVSVARNSGIKAAKYDYVTFLDADDEYLPDFLSTIKALIQDFPQAGIWGTNYWYMYSDGSRKLPVIRGLTPDFRGFIPDYFAIAANSAPVYWTGAVCIRKKALLDIGGFPVGITSGEDLLTWARICAKYPAAYDTHPKSLYYHDKKEYNTHPRTPDENDYVGVELQKIYKANKKSSIKKYIAFWYKIQLSMYLRFPFSQHINSSFMKAIYWNPYCIKTWILGLIGFLPLKLRIFLFNQKKQ